MSAGVCRWGILGTAGIARKNWAAIRNAENSILAGVASRDLGRCEQYIAECQSSVPFDPSPRAFGSYEAMLASDEIDAVYIPLPTGIRKEWAIRAVRAGKHVLGEKPSGISAAEVEEILAACRDHNVQYMDGVMFMHSKRLDRIREVLDDGRSVGQIKRVASQFSFRAGGDFWEQNIRADSELEPLGCLGDLGWYNIRFLLWVMNWRLPEKVSGRLLTESGRADDPAGVPIEFSAELFFADGVSATLYCSFITQNSQWAAVSGTEGWLHLSDFVTPRMGSEVEFTVCNDQINIGGCHFNMEEHVRRHAVREYSNNQATAQETNMMRNFAAAVLAGQPNREWGRMALQTQQVLDACLGSARQEGALVELGSPA